MALPTASDNAFPSLLVTEGTEPSAPAAGKQRVYIDSTSHHLSRTDSSGVQVDLETNQAAGGVATDAIWDAAGDLAVGSGANTAARLAVGTNGQVLTSNGTTAAWATPSSSAAIPTARVAQTAGDMTLNSTTWAEVAAATGGPGTGAFDLTIAVASGDILQVSLTGLWGPQAVAGCLDVATIVSAAPVNYISGGGGAGDFGLGAWFGDSATVSTTLDLPIGGSLQYVVQAGDISGGNVVLRLMYRTTTAANKVLRGTTSTWPLHFSVVNFGQ